MASEDIPPQGPTEDTKPDQEPVIEAGSSAISNDSTVVESPRAKESSETPTTTTTTDASRPKRTRRKILKKTSRACTHCRNAHITCDDSRPCKRCVKKGLEDTCADAPRKTKKYLLAANAANQLQLQRQLQEQQLQEEGQQQITFANNPPTTDGQFPKIPVPGTDLNSRSTSPYMIPIKQQQQQQQNNNNFSNQLPPISIGNSDVNSPTRDIEYGNFMSAAADLEYSILGSMVQNPAFFDNIMSTSPSVSNSDDGRLSASPLSQHMGYQSLGGQMSRSQSLPSSQQQQQQAYNTSINNENQKFMLNNANGNEHFLKGNSLNNNNNHSNIVNKRKSRSSIIDDSKIRVPSPLSINGATLPDTSAPKCDTYTNQYFIGAMKTTDENGSRAFTFPEVVKMISEFRNRDPLGFQELNKRSAISFSIGRNEEDERKEELETHDYPCGLRFKEPIEIYSKINEPFSYVQPYHDLNIYLRSRFDKNTALVSMAKSMAEYRPSFIAGMIHLKYDDLKFAEQCFQRTLLEYDNYIKISGTPTLVWRRTSQIAYVGDEFCILTGWKKEQLLGKSTFAVEIMDDKSCVEYFQLFSKIAFGDFKGATMTECTLLTPNGENIRTSSVWTLKRDVFGIPMMIIANFLPSLN